MYNIDYEALLLLLQLIILDANETIAHFRKHVYFSMVCAATPRTRALVESMYVGSDAVPFEWL